MAMRQDDDDRADAIRSAMNGWIEFGGPKLEPREQLTVVVDALICYEAGGEVVGAFALLTERFPPSLYDVPPVSFEEAAATWTPRDYARTLALGLTLRGNPDAKGAHEIAVLEVVAADLLQGITSTEKVAGRELRAVAEFARTLIEPDADRLPYSYGVIAGLLDRGGCEGEAPHVQAPEAAGTYKDWLKQGLEGLVTAFKVAKKLDADLDLRSVLARLALED
jgi:hypothetical protein